jgi:hypothetical protein
MAKEKEIGRIKVDDLSDIVVRLTEWRGRQRLDIRLYMDSEQYKGFTKQGIGIPLDKIDDVRTLLLKAKEELKTKPSI